MICKKKSKKFKWTEKAENTLNDIKELLISPPVLKAPMPDGLFYLESDTSREGVGGTPLQKQGKEWVVIGYHSKRLPQLAKDFRVTEQDSLLTFMVSCKYYVMSTLKYLLIIKP